MDKLLLAAAVAAPFVGSFLGTLALRLPANRPVIAARSMCDACGHPLRPSEIIPLLSWAFLRGRCRVCRAPFGLFYPGIEMAALAAVAWSATIAGGWLLIVFCVFGWQLLALGFADATSGILPDVLTLSLALSGLAAAWLVAPGALAGHVAGMIAGFLTLALIGRVYLYVRAREGIGLGDAKLLGALGAWLSWQALPTVLAYASILGLLFVLLRAAGGKMPLSGQKLAFGPFLAFAGWLVWLYGPLAAA